MHFFTPSRLSGSLVRSPAEEVQDAGTGSSSWPRRRHYAVGEEVEVLLTGQGFRGARYEATVTAHLPGSDRYKVVYSRLVKRRGGPPLREVVAASDVRPRPPPPSPGSEFQLFDLVETYHSDGWWPGVVSDIRPKRGRNQKTQFAVSFPLFRQVVKLSASSVRPRREFVYGSWIDAQEVLRGIPQYAEGSHIEVMYDKQGRVWRPAIIKKMVSSTNYVVSYGSGESSIEVLHTRFIRPEPIYDKMKLEYELKPSAEVEVYHDGIWSLGVIVDVGSCEPRRYRVKVRKHSNTYGNDYIIVSSASLRPKAKWDSPEWRIHSTKKCARKRNYSDSDFDHSSDSGYSPEFSTPGGNSDQYSSIPNKRVKKLEREWKGSGFVVAMRGDEILEANAVNLICTPCDGKGCHSLPKALASKRKDLSVSSLDDGIEIGSKYSSGDVVVISDDSSHGSYKDGGQQILLPGCLETRPLDHLHLENVLMKIDDSAAGDENNEMCQRITEVKSWVAGTSIEGAGSGLSNLRISNQKTFNQSYGGAFPMGKLEPSLSRLRDFEGSLLCIEAPNDSKIDAENNKTGISPEEAGAFPIGKLEPPSSRQKGVKADLVCIEAYNDNKVEIKNERMGMSLVSAEGFHPETCRNSIVTYSECNASSQLPWSQPLEPVSEKSAGPSSLLDPGVMTDISAFSEESSGPSLLLHPGVMTDISAFMPLAVPNSSNLFPVFSTTSLLLMPKNKTEVFEKLPQNPHFREAWNCPPERREGRAIELMVSFANMAVSIKNMRIQDEPRLYDEKMRILLDMEEENGFEAGPLKVRLHNLLCTRTCHNNLKNRKLRLEKEIMEIEAMNCGLEQRLKVLDMCVMGMEENKYKVMKASFDMQKTENCSSISKLQVDLCQVEESLKFAEADFCRIATAPWQPDDGLLLP